MVVIFKKKNLHLCLIIFSVPLFYFFLLSSQSTFPFYFGPLCPHLDSGKKPLVLGNIYGTYWSHSLAAHFFFYYGFSLWFFFKKMIIPSCPRFVNSNEYLIDFISSTSNLQKLNMFFWIWRKLCDKNHNKISLTSLNPNWIEHIYEMNNLQFWKQKNWKALRSTCFSKKNKIVNKCPKMV